MGWKQKALYVSFMVGVVLLFQWSVYCGAYNRNWTLREIFQAARYKIIGQRPPDNVAKVILISYMRAGTSFLGSAFEKSKDSFYLFEPEWFIAVHARNEYRPLRFLDDRVQHIGWNNYDKAIEQLIHNYLYCNISGVDANSLLGPFLRESHATAEFNDCIRLNSLQDCAQGLAKVCNSKKFRFLKTIHVRIDVALDLLKKDPSLKVIHLIRDPRGIAISRMNLSEYYVGSPIQTFGRVCAEMLRDIEVLESIPSDLSKRIFPVLYEDLAERPEEIIAELYSFLEVTQPEYIETYIRQITHAKMDNRTGFSTQRVNSTKTAHSWRSTISFILCKKIDHMCARVYKKTGYLPIKTRKELLDYNIQLRLPRTENPFLQRWQPTK